MRRICVYCGSSPGARPAYRTAASGLGVALARSGLEMIYGGADAGLMAAVAEACLGAGGRVTGVLLQRFVEHGLAPTGLTSLEVVETMHERKGRMAQLADGFVALPGGLGTLDEFFEVLTWTQIGIHAKPCGLLNVAGYFNPLLAFLDDMVNERFLISEHRELVQVDSDPAGLLARLEAWRPPCLPKWVDRHVAGDA